MRGWTPRGGLRGGVRGERLGSGERADFARPGARRRHVRGGRAGAARRVLRTLPQRTVGDRTRHRRHVGRRRPGPRRGPRRGPGARRASAAGRHDAAGRLAAARPGDLRRAHRVARSRARSPRGAPPPAAGPPPPEPHRVRQRRPRSARGRGRRGAAAARRRLEPGVRQPGGDPEPVAGPHRGLPDGGGAHQPGRRRQRDDADPDRLPRRRGRHPELPRRGAPVRHPAAGCASSTSSPPTASTSSGWCR